jgi:hypothetical protein
VGGEISGRRYRADASIDEIFSGRAGGYDLQELGRILPLGEGDGRSQQFFSEEDSETVV